MEREKCWFGGDAALGSLCQGTFPKSLVFSRRRPKQIPLKGHQWGWKTLPGELGNFLDYFSSRELEFCPFSPPCGAANFWFSLLDLWCLPRTASPHPGVFYHFKASQKHSQVEFEAQCWHLRVEREVPAPSTLPRQQGVIAQVHIPT